MSTKYLRKLPPAVSVLLAVVMALCLLTLVLKCSEENCNDNLREIIPFANYEQIYEETKRANFSDEFLWPMKYLLKASDIDTFKCDDSEETKIR
uniref:Uncharacterized protein n=1 Tax=Globodera rostochiensis TaxID=31243 RepID=A0A914HIQ5_GLORO